jgi:hypothetical protein
LYSSRREYLDDIRAAAEALVTEGFALQEDIAEIVQYSSTIWDTVVGP